MFLSRALNYQHAPSLPFIVVIILQREPTKSRAQLTLVGRASSPAQPILSLSRENSEINIISVFFYFDRNFILFYISFF